ncbi:Hypothetical predicted protein [Octopus vulgaris]|uniref:Uncharacterized protein n=1 Tax=Octopus vulgaris TaxID=6645 RepID=A0AA36BMJ7_OCTVU|nr:Hypothetical predicted protein [Octopus vulgaris]
MKYWPLRLLKHMQHQEHNNDIFEVLADKKSSGYGSTRMRSKCRLMIQDIEKMRIFYHSLPESFQWNCKP